MSASEMWMPEHHGFSPRPLLIAASEVLAGIDHAELTQFIGARPMTRAVRAYRDALRQPR